jgi:hypothetical protein
MGQGQLAPYPHQRKTRRIQPPAPPALHKGIRAALGHFDQYGREAGRGSRYFDSWCHRLIWSWSLLKLRIENHQAQFHDLRWQGLQGTCAGLGFGGSAPPKVCANAQPSRAGARRRLLIAINKGGSRVTFGECAVLSPPRRQRRAQEAHQSQRSEMRRTPLASDGTRAPDLRATSRGRAPGSRRLCTQLPSSLDECDEGVAVAVAVGRDVHSETSTMIRHSQLH